MRKILIVLGILIGLVLAIAVYVVTNIVMTVKSRIERTGSRIAKVPVTVGEVDISVSRGTATIRDLVVANPPGFSDEPAMRFGEISALVEITSGTIGNITVTRPHIRVEGPARRTNLDVLRGNAASPNGEAGSGGGAGSRTDASGGGASDDAQGDAASQDVEEQEARRIYTIERLEIDQASVQVALDTMDAPVELTLDNLVLRNLEGTRSQVARQIL